MIVDQYFSSILVYDVDDLEIIATDFIYFDDIYIRELLVDILLDEDLSFRAAAMKLGISKSTLHRIASDKPFSCNVASRFLYAIGGDLSCYQAVWGYPMGEAVYKTSLVRGRAVVLS